MKKNANRKTKRVACFIEGRKFNLYTITKGEEDEEESDIGDFINSLEIRDCTRVHQYLGKIADNGPPRNKRKFNYEGDGIWAIKHEQVRIYCCYHNDKIILLTNGVIKKRQKANPSDLKKAKKIREECKNLSWDD